MASAEFDTLYKIIIIGDSAVGKSCILLQFSDKTFSENYVSTIGVDFKIRTMEVNGQNIKLQIWDTAGQERFKSITENYYRGAHAIAIVYDITNRDSFENVRKWVNEVDKIANPQVCKIIVGNKTDLEEKRQVRREEGQAFADSLGVPFIETSAKNAYNVQKLFEEMCLAISKRRGNKGIAPGPAPVIPKHGTTVNNGCSC